MSDPKVFTLFYYIKSGGDGSAYPKFFANKEARDAFMKHEEDSPHFEGFCEADGQVEFVIKEDGTMHDATEFLNPEWWELWGKKNPKIIHTFVPRED